MRNKLNFIFPLILSLCLLWGLQGHAQKKISVSASNLPLSTILKNLSNEYNIRFAFNDDLFSQINSTIQFKNIPIEKFLNELSLRFGLNYRLIGGTYVFYIADEIKMAEAISTSLSRIDSVLVADQVLPEVHREYLISGMVKNAKTGERIKYCTLKFDKSVDVITNEMGYFSTIKNAEGEIQIEIQYLGYKQLDTTILIQSTMPPLDLLLHPFERIEPMKRYEFRRFRFIADLPEVPEFVVFNPKSTLEVPALESNDLVNALTIIPGINYLKGPDYGLSIRGGASSDNLVLIDGIPIIETSHLMGNLSVLNSKYIQQAFVSRGGFGAEYGGRTSGIVDLTGKTGNNDVAVVDFTVNLLHSNIYVGLPITEKSSLSGSFKKSFVDVWPGYLINNFALENKSIQTDDGLSGNAFVNRTIVNYSDANLKLSIRPTNNSEVTLNYFSSFDSQIRDYGFPITEDYTIENNSKSKTSGYSFNYKSQKQLGWMNSLSIGYNQLESNSLSNYNKETRIKDQLVKPFSDAEFIDLNELRVLWKSEVIGRYLTQRFGMGFNSNRLAFNYEDYEIKITGANNFNDSISSSSFVQLANSFYEAKITPAKWVSIRGGVRGLYRFNKQKISFQPRYGIELMPTKYLKFHYSGGRYVQHMYLAYRIDSYHNISSIWFIPETEQQILDAVHHIVGSRLVLKNLLLNVEAYQKNNRNKTFFIGSPAISDGLEIVNYNQNIGSELNRGVDLFLQYQTSVFKHLISYSISESFEKIEGMNNNTYFPSVDHQLHRLRLTEIVNWKGWTASMNWSFANGNPYMLNTSTNTQLNFNSHPNFLQMDVALVKEFQFQNFYVDLGFTVLNVFDRRNEIGMKNYVLPEGSSKHVVNVTTTATSFSPLFYINLRYE